MKHLFHKIKRSVIDGFLLRGYRFKMPMTLIIETSNHCSLRCSCCPNGQRGLKLRPRGTMSRETFEKILKHIDIPIKHCFLHLCGEPLLNKNIPYFAELLNKQKIVSTVFSNGYNIDYDTLDKLLEVKLLKMAFSMDLISPEHYESIRTPGKYDLAVDSLNKINDIFIRHKKFYGLNIIVKPDITTSQLKSTTEDLFNRYSQLISISYSSEFPWPGLPNTGYIAGHVRSHRKICREVYSTLPILWNGDVAMCNLDYSGETIIGNILSDKYSRIFNNREARRFRRMHFFRQWHKNNLCNNCLISRWNSVSRTIYRGKFKKLSPTERNNVFNLFPRYYER